MNVPWVPEFPDPCPVPLCFLSLLSAKRTSGVRYAQRPWFPYRALGGRGNEFKPPDMFRQCWLTPVNQQSHFWVCVDPRACARLFAAIPVPAAQSGNFPQDHEFQKGDIVVTQWDNERW